MFVSYYHLKILFHRLWLLGKLLKQKSKYNEQAELANQVVWRSDLYMSQPPKEINLFILYYYHYHH